MRVSVRDVCSSGYSWVRLNSDGDMMAGHRKRRNREPLMRRSAISSRPRSAQRTLQEAKTSFSSRGNTLWRQQHQCLLTTTLHVFTFNSPMGVDDFAEGQLTAHAKVGLMVWQNWRWYSHRVHFTIFFWLVQGSYELPWRLQVRIWITLLMFCLILYIFDKKQPETLHLKKVFKDPLASLLFLFCVIMTCMSASWTLGSGISLLIIDLWKQSTSNMRRL